MAQDFEYLKKTFSLKKVRLQRRRKIGLALFFASAQISNASKAQVVLLSFFCKHFANPNSD
jgi:hypothetical protein